MRDDESLSEDTDSGNGEKGKYMKDITEEELTVIKSDWMWRTGRSLDDSQVSGLDSCMHDGANQGRK